MGIPKSLLSISRVSNVFSGTLDKVDKRRGSRSLPARTRNRCVDVDIGDYMLLDPVGEVLAPLSAFDETVLLSIPTSNDNDT